MMNCNINLPLFTLIDPLLIVSENENHFYVSVLKLKLECSIPIIMVKDFTIMGICPNLIKQIHSQMSFYRNLQFLQLHSQSKRTARKDGKPKHLTVTFNNLTFFGLVYSIMIATDAHEILCYVKMSNHFCGRV